MFERILIPLDGSVMAEKVLPQVRRILHYVDAEIILVRAAVPMPFENGVVLAPDDLATARSYLQRIGDEMSGASVKLAARGSTAASLILTVAEEEKVSLIAMATHGQRGLKRVLLGSVAESVLRKSPVPVLAVRPFALHEEHRPFRNILVPVEKGGGIGPAEDLARLFDARLLLLRILDDAVRKGVDLHQERVQAEAELQQLEEGLEARGVEVISLLQTGPAVEEILHAVRIHEVDLIAMRTHGRSGLSRAVKGSVTEEVLREAWVPMLISRIPDHRKGTATPEEIESTHPGSRMVF
jgi:nucleotide-binding universal stress UspA family protein